MAKRTCREWKIAMGEYYPRFDQGEKKKIRTVPKGGKPEGKRDITVPGVARGKKKRGSSLRSKKSQRKIRKGPVIKRLSKQVTHRINKEEGKKRFSRSHWPVGGGQLTYNPEKGSKEEIFSPQPKKKKVLFLHLIEIKGEEGEYTSRKNKVGGNSL